MVLKEMGLKTDEQGQEVGCYEIRVIDTGIGMTEEFAAKVFDAYERDRTVGNIQGTGLGTAISKNIIDLMGGSVKVKTALNKGTEFIVRVDFPLSTEIADAKSDADEEEIDFSKIRLLLAEDIEVNREIATLILDEFGIKVETAENGKIAFDKVRRSTPGYYQLVLMDVQMPEMNGYEAARAIRALPDSRLSTIPIVAMTANAFAEDVEEAKKAGMNAHIAKPLDVPKMMATLKEVLIKTKS